MVRGPELYRFFTSFFNLLTSPKPPHSRKTRSTRKPPMSKTASINTHQSKMEDNTYHQTKEDPQLLETAAHPDEASKSSVEDSDAIMIDPALVPMEIPEKNDDTPATGKVADSVPYNIETTTEQHAVNPQHEQQSFLPLDSEANTVWGSPIPDLASSADLPVAELLVTKPEAVGAAENPITNKPRTEVKEIITKPRERIHMGSLAPKKWLSDEPVNEVMSIITILGSMGGNPAFGAVSSFHANPSPKDKTVQKYIEQMVATGTPLLIPINGQQHWQLAVVYPAERRVDIYESMNTTGYEKFAHRVVDNFLTKHFPNCDCFAWEKITMAGPFQDNDYDCGIMTIVTAAYLVLGRRIPKRLDGSLWRNLLHCLLQVLDGKADAKTVARRMEEHLLRISPPAIPPKHISELSLFDDRFDDREYHGDLALWEKDAAHKIEKINEVLRSLPGAWQTSRLADEPFQVLTALRDRCLADLNAALPQIVDFNDQAGSEEIGRTLTEVRAGLRKDLLLWQQLHNRGLYNNLTSPGLNEVKASLAENRKLTMAVKGLGGIHAVLDGITTARKAHVDVKAALEEDRKELLGRRAGLNKLIAAAEVPRGVKRKADWETE